MPIETINYKDHDYPLFQAQGNAAKFCIPFALEVCKGEGLDVGYNRDEWKFPGALGIDPIHCPYHAMKLPSKAKAIHEPCGFGFTNYKEEYSLWDYIFSSHCLEHIKEYDWVATLDYWKTMLKPGGVLFLYLPHYSQEYWRPWNNRKHNHIFTPEIIKDYLEDRGWNKIFVSDCDLNNSFIALAEK